MCARCVKSACTVRLAVGVGWLLAAGCGPKPPVYATLIEAVEQGDVPDVRRHVYAGADVNEPGEEGWTALMTAAYQGDLRLVRFLLQQGANIQVANSAGATALMVAIHNGHPKVVQHLLDHGADPNARTPKGRTPLMLAVRRGDARLIEPLLEHGADVEAQDRQGITVEVELARLEGRTGYKRSDLKNCLARYGLAGSDQPGAGTETIRMSGNVDRRP